MVKVVRLPIAGPPSEIAAGAIASVNGLVTGATRVRLGGAGDGLDAAEASNMVIPLRILTLYERPAPAGDEFA